MAVGAGAAAVMTITSLITLAIRIGVETIRKNNLGEEMHSATIKDRQDTNLIIKSSDINHCPSCHNVITEKTNFCNICGAALKQDSEPESH